MPLLEHLKVQVTIVVGSKHLAPAASEDNLELQGIANPWSLPERTEVGCWS